MNEDGIARALRATIEMKRAEVASLESALDIIEGVDAVTCGKSDVSPCYGQVFTRFCSECSAVFTYCERHGGARGAAYRHAHCDHGEPHATIEPVVVRDVDLPTHGARKGGLDTAKRRNWTARHGEKGAKT